MSKSKKKKETKAVIAGHPNEATRISMVWQSIPSQLAKENKNVRRLLA